MKNYTLMHKNEECGILTIDETTGRFEDYRDYNRGFSPFLNNATLENMKKWWELRAIPASRETIRDLIASLDVVTNEEYLAKNLALSVIDSYWIKPFEASIDYNAINFYSLINYNEGKIPYHNPTSYDPNASLSGQMEKYWDISGTVPVLVKEAYKSFGQQSVNEAFASLLHSKQMADIPFVKYNITSRDDGSIASMCNAFTTKDIEYVSAYEILYSEKHSNDVNDYNAYIEICQKHGIDVRDFMDYQTLTDFVLTNTDEHLMNFGILRDSNTLEFIGPAPIFDSGNSMFFDNLGKNPYTRVELLNQKMTSFYKSEERMLSNVKNKLIVDTDLLPLPNEVADFYREKGIPDSRADIIAANYANKVIILQEFQHGKSISLYNEKHKHQKLKRT
ncbi:MAG: hypothetical protein J6X36_09140 [Lachnospiraceae bacterium]|nr:hypothetical protein [Lachnospiraceae bacterium]